jgi:UDP-galactopyranose mutase
MVPQGKSSICAEVAYSATQPVCKETIAETVIKDLIKTGILSVQDKTELIAQFDLKYAYVIFDHQRKRNVNKIKRYFKEHSVILAGRYGNWEYQWTDDAILDGKRAAQTAASLCKMSHSHGYRL